ncbi:2-oxo acid dehydrogenase subunit E2 [Pontiella agarivorans]|uniref:Dihydrolipoamide acetyltransferase component of pyruvate dehydrogenase complex n=1 Tax=Pontiella agarivorans TaxID=3038953 RepID=A0ABU5N0L7_9BACT|nr:2-oxo acid dehydrogenase subunit E2 [Pontiella agarivorans]MDZ8119963.1 2-oxo acid dehydrogenase subunit E2 [Pontiella agarivorans]
MALEFKLPELGENIESGDVVNVLVEVGEAVTEGQSLVEIEAGKASMEIPAPAAGTISAIHVATGDTVEVGQLAFTIDDGGAAAPAADEVPAEEPAPVAEAAPAEEAPAAAEEAPAPAGGGETIEFKLPDLGENIESGDIINVLVAEGDSVDEGQGLLEIEAGKASMEIPAPAAGVIKAVHVAQGDTVSIGTLAFTIESSGGAAPAAAPAPAAKPVPAAPAPKSAAREPEQPVVVRPPEPKKPEPVKHQRPVNAVSAAPNVRRLARELGVDIHMVKPSREGGRISMEDVKNHAKGTIESGGGGGSRPSVQGAVRVEKMSAIRKATMNHMTHCWTTIPHVTQQDWADITHLDELRKKFAKKAEVHGAKLTVTAILVKVVASALKAFPNFNCSIDTDNAEIIYKDFYNIGIAVDTEKGLMVPVIRDADQKNMIQLAGDLGSIAQKTREGKIGLEDMQGGTFTISNLGGIGGTFFTPIVNSPEVAILGVGRAVKKDGRMMMPLSLSYDHRIIDGADGARFIRWIVDALEEPLLLALEG